MTQIEKRILLLLMFSRRLFVGRSWLLSFSNVRVTQIHYFCDATEFKQMAEMDKWCDSH